MAAEFAAIDAAIARSQQLLEAHEGVAILATNRRAAIDPAFIRRLRHSIDFPRPNAAERAKIWRLALAALDSELAKDRAALTRLAERHDLTPAQIKGAVLSATYTALEAGRATMPEDLEAGAIAERVKEGRAPASVAVTAIRPGRNLIRG